MSTSTRKPGRLLLLRDTLSWIGGWALIVHQVVIVSRADFNLWPLLLGGSLIGAPGVAEILKLRTGTSESGGSSPASASSSLERQ